MKKIDGKAKALFIAPDGSLYPDYLVCSGQLLTDLGGRPCSYSQNGRLPDLQPLGAHNTTYSLDKGKPGDLFPPCAKQHLANLGHWEGHRGQHFPDELKPLRLFKCSQWLWLVVLGLHDSTPTHIRQEDE